MNPQLHRLLGGILRPIVRSWGKLRMAKHSGEVLLPGLGAAVEIRRDAQGVPHIYAQSKADAFFAQGYAHCQDRLWQMEVNRRLALGRISEVFGKVALDTDRMARTFGFGRLGFEDLNLITPELRGLLQSYCDGVNACMAKMGNKLPVEFSLAGYKPQPWTPQHVLAFTRLMTFQLTYGWGHELSRARLYEALGPELAKELDNRYNPEHPLTLPNGLSFHQLDAEGVLKAFEGPFIHPTGGSNAWALSGSRTDTGHPYLCSDPHLIMTMPAIWYQVYLEAPGLRVQGVSIPGMPLVMIGHNAHIAWGITLAYSDTQDTFIEQFESADSDRYLQNGTWVAAQVVEEKIKVKGEKEAHVERIRITGHGPVISDALTLPYRNAATHKLTLCSPAMKSAPLIMGWMGLDLATGWNDFVHALDIIDAPGLNIVYADVSGNIGYRMTGKTPIRAKGQGEFPRPGWDGEFDWTGFVPKDQMPSTLNPPSGYVISANNKAVPDDFPYFMGNIWMNGYRAARIDAMLSAKPKWAAADFRAIHMDILCQPGLAFARQCAGLRSTKDMLSKDAAKALEILCAWDGQLGIDSVAGSIYQVCRRKAVKILFKAASDDAEAHDWAVGKGMEPLLLKVSEFQGKDTEALLELLANPDSKLLAMSGGKEKLLQTALEAGVAWLRENLGPDIAAWKWGRLHQVEFPHPMSVRKPLDLVFNVGPFPVYGDTDTVCQTSTMPHQPYNANMALPSYRQIVDLGDFNKSLWIMPPGQSGQIGSVNYSDQVAPWMEGRYFPMAWDRTQVEALAKKVLWLRPTNA